MLVLTRKKGERVLIGDDIVITLIDIRGDGVRIGFDAPRGVKIQRAEVIKAVSEANTEAAASSAETGDLLVGLLAARRSAPAEQPAPEVEAVEPSSAAGREAAASSGTDAADAPAASAAPRQRPKPAPRRPRD